MFWDMSIIGLKSMKGGLMDVKKLLLMAMTILLGCQEQRSHHHHKRREVQKRLVDYPARKNR